MSRGARIAELRRRRPKSALLRWSALALGVLLVGSWSSGELSFGELLGPRRLANLRRFLGTDVVPFPLRAEGAGLGELWTWTSELLAGRGLPAALETLWIALAAMVLAGLCAALAAPFAAATLMSADPWAAGGALEAPRRSLGWRLASGAARGLLVLPRAIPEYVAAYLLLALLGPSAWPAVLALAIHNAGILGRLGADTLENLEAAPLRALRAAGATRAQLVLLAVWPLALNRFLLYFFYRLETCIREATVLGMLGVVSLGYWIEDARSRHWYDEMLLLVGVGIVLVLAVDLLSYASRALLRRAA